MEEFLEKLVTALIGIAIIISIWAVDKWLGSFWAFLLSFILFIAFLIGAMIAVGYAMEAISKYRSEVEMEEAEEIAKSFNEEIANSFNDKKTETTES